LYGATKLASDKLFVAANNITGSANKRFSVVRYGNVMGSNGSVIPFFLNKKAENQLPVTDERMTRFNITLNEGVHMVLFALENCMGGEILVPKIPSYKILDVAKAVSEDAEIVVVGIRPGEKLHEEMISYSDSFNTYSNEDYYFILPTKIKWDIEQFKHKLKAKKIKEQFSYSSDTNPHFLTKKELKDLIEQELG
jgi:FlaA1/EpsC-like NDP-sugar epimerase